MTTGIEPLEIVAGQAVAGFKRGRDHIITAAQRIAECHRRVADGEFDGSWSQFRRNHLQGISIERCEELLLIGLSADPHKTMCLTVQRKSEERQKKEAQRTAKKVAVAVQAEKTRLQQEQTRPKPANSTTVVPPETIPPSLPEWQATWLALTDDERAKRLAWYRTHPFAIRTSRRI